MAQARELEDMAAQVRTRPEHGNIPNAEWQRLTEAAESAFEGKSRDHRPDADMRAAMDLAREMGTAELERPNPFSSPALRESYESAERAGLLHRWDQYETARQAGVDGQRIPEEFLSDVALLKAYDAGLKDRATNFAIHEQHEGGTIERGEWAAVRGLQTSAAQAIERAERSTHPSQPFFLCEGAF